MIEKQNNPLISIAVPVYNSEKYLNVCLKSLIAQTYKNLEIVVLNNDSTDNSLQIIEEYAKRDARIKYYTIPHVPTETWSRNNAYVRTTAEWVIPIDSDDSIEPEYVEKLWNRHLATGAEWVGATMTLIDQKGNICGRIPKDYFDYSQILKGKDAVILTLKGWLINGNGALIHRNLVPCIVSRETKPQFNVEYDTRVILYQAEKVAFVDAKYFFGYNPNSVGRKPSFTKLTYVLHSYVGLLPFITAHYDTSSEELSCITGASASLIIRSFKTYLTNKGGFTKEQNKDYKAMILSLYKNLSFVNIKDSLFKKFLKILLAWMNVNLLKVF